MNSTTEWIYCMRFSHIFLSLFVSRLYWESVWMHAPLQLKRMKFINKNTILLGLYSNHLINSLFYFSRQTIHRTHTNSLHTYMHTNKHHIKIMRNAMNVWDSSSSSYLLYIVCKRNVMVDCVSVWMSFLLSVNFVLYCVSREPCAPYWISIWYILHCEFYAKILCYVVMSNVVLPNMLRAYVRLLLL